MSAPILLFNSHHQPQVLDPRDRYLTALAEVKAAEKEYVAYAHAREKALQRQRERRQVVLALQQQYDEAVRKQRLADALLMREVDLTSGYPEHYYYGTADADVYEELAARKALKYQQHQAALVQQRLALLQEHQAREQAKARALVLARRQAEEQARINRSSEEGGLKSILNLLLDLGNSATPSRENLQQHLPPTSAPRQGCASHCASGRQPSPSNVKVRSDGDEVEQFVKFIFGRQSAAQLKEKEEEKGQTKESEPQDCNSTCRHAQAPPTPAASPNPVPVPTPNTSISTLAEASTIPFTPNSVLSHLQSRLDCETEPEVTATLRSLLASLGQAGANLERTPRVEKRKNIDNTSTPEQSSGSSGLSLKEQLEARLRRDPNVEVHDTVQAMLASLATANDSQTSTRTPSSSGSPPEITDGKGKGKAVVFDLPKDISHELHTPTSKDVSDSMSAVHNIEETFNTLRTDFSFPTHLDFTPPSSAPSSPHASDSESTLTSKLAYTANNSPVRYYDQALNALLGQLDEVESWGNEEVRKERKAVVGRVKSALEDVEREVQERFVQRNAKEAGRAITAENNEVKVEGTPVPVVDEVTVKASVPDLESESGMALSFSGAVSPIAPKLTGGQKSSASSELTAEETEESTLDASRATVTPFVDNVNTETPSLAETFETPNEAAAQPVQSSYPPTLSPAEPALLVPIVQPDSEPLDTFLLPATSPIIPKRPNVTEDAGELVVVDKHGEGSDWSEVEA